MKITEKEIKEAARLKYIFPTSGYINEQREIENSKRLLTRGFIEGAQWAISLQPEWVSVSERLPCEGEEVNVSYEHSVLYEDKEVIESGVTTATFSTHELLRPVFCKSNGWVVLCVTHWMPLPQPPTK